MKPNKKFRKILFRFIYCGRQKDFVKQYLESRRDKIFSDVEVLTFVVQALSYDNSNADDHIEDIELF